MILVPLVWLLYPALVGHQNPEWENASGVPGVVKRALALQPHWKFTGTRVVSVRRGPELTQHTEYITRDGRRLRIDFPGESRYTGEVIVETETDRRHFIPKKNEIHITPPRLEPLFEHLRGAWRGEHGIRLTEEAGDKVAGQSTRMVKVFDEKGNRLQELSIEPRTGLVLSYRWFDKVGTVDGSYEYRAINLHPNIDPSVFTLRRNGAKITTPADDLRKIVVNTNFIPLMIPSSTGILLDSVRIHDIAGQPVLISQYIAPQGRFFLFQASVGVDPAVLERKAPKDIHTVTIKIDGRSFAAVGPLDEAVLRAAISSLRTGA